MIVSHKHRFIFVHLGRTAGRSLTAALAPYCDPGDIVTPAGKGTGRNHDGFERHFTAQEIRDRVGREVFDSYFKFAIERNPWDKIISRYWAYAGVKDLPAYKRVPELLTGKPLTFHQWFELRILQARFLTFGHYRFPRHYDAYMEDGRPLVDFIGRYENLAAHLAVISERIGVPIVLEEQRGTNRHKERKPYTELFDARMNRIVEDWFRKDLDFLGYRFGEPPPMDYLEFPRAASG
ncbi:MAG: hypothetical protein J0H08_17445 [Rhizobiales bacterium]|nr:hypothetical protein [Hyphomicrobiales bacterium]